MITRRSSYTTPAVRSGCAGVVLFILAGCGGREGIGSGWNESDRSGVSAAQPAAATSRTAHPERPAADDLDRADAMDDFADEQAGAFRHDAPSTAPLTLERLFEIAEHRNADLRAAHADLDAARGRLAQAHTWRNPELEIELEEVPAAPPEPADGMGTLRLKQPVTLTDRRALDQAAARADFAALEAQLEATRRRVRRDIEDAWIEAISLRQSAAWHWDHVAVTEAILAEFEAAAEAAREQAAAHSPPPPPPRVRPADISRARLLVEESRLDLTRLVANQLYGIQRLTRLLGGEPVTLDRLRGELRTAVDESDFGFTQDGLFADQPELRAARLRVDEARWRVRVAEVPIDDITIGAGIGRAFSREETFLSGMIGIPLPVWDRYSARARIARAELLRRRAEVSATAANLRIDIEQTLQLVNEYDTFAAVYHDRLVPEAEAALESAREDWRAGEGRALDVLDAARVVIAAKAGEITALTDFNRALSRLRALRGQPPRAVVEPAESTE